MAEGEFAEPIWRLLAELEDKLGGVYKADEAVLNELIRWLSGDDIGLFVEDFRRNNEIPDRFVELPLDRDQVVIENTPWDGDTIYK